MILGGPAFGSDKIPEHDVKKFVKNITARNLSIAKMENDGRIFHFEDKSLTMI